MCALDQLARLGVGADVEADDRRLAGRGQRHVAFGDRADARIEHAHLDLVVRQVVQRGDDRLDRPCTSAFTTTGYSMTSLFRPENIVSRLAGRGRGALRGRLFLAILRRLRGRAASFSTTVSWSPASGTPPRPSTSTGIDGPASLICWPLSSTSARTRPLSVPTTKMSPRLSVPRLTSTVATGPRPLSSLRLDHGRLGVAIGVGLQFQQFGLEQDLLDQLVEPGAGLGRDLDVLHVAAHRLDHDLVLEQALADPLRVGLGLVDLVDRHDHRHAGGLGVVDRLDRLRHDPVVGRDHQHHDVGDVGTARAHLGERLVARGVEEGDLVLPLVVIW